jgi:hypothetical protein
MLFEDKRRKKKKVKKKIGKIKKGYMASMYIGKIRKRYFRILPLQIARSVSLFHSSHGP